MSTTIMIFYTRLTEKSRLNMFCIRSSDFYADLRSAYIYSHNPASEQLSIHPGQGVLAVLFSAYLT